MSVLLLVNDAVFATSDLEKACLPNVSFLLYDPVNDTYASLLEKIALLNISSFSEVGLVFDESFATGPTFKLLSSQLVPSILADVEATDPTLSSWSEFSAFLGDLVNIYSMKTLDFFACSLYSNLSWQYVFNALDYRHEILIQASTDITGNITSGANWIMESDGVNIRDVYFNADIEKYPYTFYGSRSNVWIKNGAPFFTNDLRFNCYLPTGITAKSIGSISLGQTTTYVIGSDNILYGFTFDGSVLNYYFTPISNVPTTNGVPKTPVQMRCGWSYIMVLFTDGTMYGIGRNTVYSGEPWWGGQLGDGTINNSANVLTFTSNPAILPTNTGIVEFDCSHEDTVIIYKDINGVNCIIGFGAGSAGNLAFPGSTGDYYPTHLSAGGDNIMIIYENAAGSKKLYMGGANNNQQLSNTGLFPNAWWNPIKDATSVVPNGVTIASISCNGTKQYILSTSGILYGIGENSNGCMGIDPTYNTYPSNINSFRQIPMSLSSPIIGFIDCESSISILCADNSIYGNYGFMGSAWWTSWQVGQTIAPSNDSWIFISGSLSIAAPPPPQPSAPTGLSVSGTGVSGQVSIAFTAPSSDGGSAITNYQYSIDDGATFITLSPVQTSNPLIITGLTNGTTYTVLLKAVNAAGESEVSTASGSVTPYTNPSAPTSLIATASNAQISVAFTPSSSNGSEITNYQYSIDGGATFITLSPLQTSNPLLISGLTNGNLYTVYLEAVNLAGASDSSSASNSVTPRIRPTVDPRYSIAPPAPTLSASGLIISVTAGMFNGSITTNYQWSADNSTWISMSPVQTITPFTLIPSGLTAGSDYTIYVRAINVGFINGLSASISISVPSPTYVASVVTIPAVSITAGSIGSAVTTVTASLGTTLTAGALANSNVLTVDLSAATNITSIPEGTFNGSTLTSIILPDTITSIGSNAFAGCLLETIIIPASVTTISSGAFAGCALTTIIIPASVTTIGAGAFQGTLLSSISLSSGTIIGEYALANCTSITQVSF